MNPNQNLANIDKGYLELLASLPARKRKRFLDGEFTDDSEGALWTDKLINAHRVTADQVPPLKRFIIALDPSVTSKDTSDECGIVALGIDFIDHVYVFEDSTDIFTPTGWAKKAIQQYKKYKADRIVGEVNNGGDLIETVIRNVDENVSYSSVRATRDKLTRAEPVAALYEQGRVHHVGSLPDLELEQTTWEAKKGEKSPNRIDALVWGVTELALQESFELW